MKPRLMKRMMWSHMVVLIAVSFIQNAVGQSNYASHANNVDYLGKGLPEEATLDGKVSTQKHNKLWNFHASITITTSAKLKQQQQHQLMGQKMKNSSTASIARYFQLLSSVACI